MLVHRYLLSPTIFHQSGLGDGITVEFPLTRPDRLGVESLVPVCPHQFLDLLPVPHKERGAILERRRCAVALAESLRGWIPILAPQFQLLELLAHSDGRQPELLPEIRLVCPDVSKFLLSFLSHPGNSRQNLYTQLQSQKNAQQEQTRSFACQDAVPFERISP